MPKISVGAEENTETSKIRNVVRAAFGREDEANLVEALRESHAYRPNLSLVAHLDGDAAGHVMFSKFVLDDYPEKDALVLAPLAVSPEHQRSGVGSELVRVGLQTARESGYELVFLHGDSDYYERFGFTPAIDAGFENPFDMPDEGFLVCGLAADSLADVAGTLTYPTPFRE